MIQGLHAERIGFSRKAAQVCCLISLIFASADLWPTLSAGFTFRLPQVLIPACVLLLLPTLKQQAMRSIPGSMWCLLWVAWTAMSLPLSLYVDRSLGYAFWLSSNLLMIFVFVQSFRASGDAERLVSWFLLAFLVQSIFGLVQLAAGMVGIDLFVSEWWVFGRLPRVNGLTYEPSYYATYLLPGWVFSLYLMENKRRLSNSARLVRATAVLTTIALLVSSSRIGWGLMVAWLASRLVVYGFKFILGRPLHIRNLRRIIYALLSLPVAACLLINLAPNAVERISETTMFALSGIGLFGTASHSADYRSGGLLMTWNAFLAHPVLGTGLGAVPVEIASQQGAAVNTLEDAKANEGMSVIVEAAASIGIIGLIISGGFFISALTKYRTTYKNSTEERKLLLGGMAWALTWLLLALQFNQNFLRLYVWMDIAVAISLIQMFSVPEEN